MARPLRYFPARSLVEVTVRTIHGRMLLRPSPRLNELVIGILARAQRRFAMPIVAVTVLSNHCHWQCIPDDAVHLARFQQYVLSKMARETRGDHAMRCIDRTAGELLDRRSERGAKAEARHHGGGSDDNQGQ